MAIKSKGRKASTDECFLDSQRVPDKVSNKAESSDSQSLFQVAFLQSEFQRDACLVDEEFHDDFFRLAPGSENKKSRPYLVFRFNGQGDLLVPLRHQSTCNIRMQNWYVQIGEPVYDKHYPKERQPTAELSKAFWIMERYFRPWPKWILESRKPVKSLKNAYIILQHAKEITKRVEAKVGDGSFLKRHPGTIDFVNLCEKVNKYRVAVDRFDDRYLQEGPEGSIYCPSDWFVNHQKVISELDRVYTKYSTAAIEAVKSFRMTPKEMSSEEKRVLDEARNYVKLFIDECEIQTNMDENGKLQINDMNFRTAQARLWKKIRRMEQTAEQIENQNEIKEENQNGGK